MRTRFLRFQTLAIGAGLACTVAPALAGQPDAAAYSQGAIEQLKPGEFLWAPQLAPAGPVMIIVSLRAQKAFVYRNGVPIAVSTVSTGKEGHETPTGVFSILQKDVEHYSSLYDNAPMPFMQRLTWRGVALHAGQLPGYPASHGCIRLPHEFARLLFGITQLGLTVVVTDAAEVPMVVSGPVVLDPPLKGDHPTPTRFRWHPERSLTGPISIVISGRDRKLIVLRNGIEIGSSEIAFDGPVTITEAFTLSAVDKSGTHWMRLPLPGGAGGSTGELTPQERARGHLPEAFRTALASVLQPGATLLVTRETLRSAGTGTQISLLESEEP